MTTNLWLWGFTDSAETWNGRFAMIGFISVVLIELLSGQQLLHLAGIMHRKLKKVLVKIKLQELFLIDKELVQRSH
uniref:Hypothetical chloroplast RF17 n=1 Tax=Wildemania schizophylla TaxID=1134705 RepID=A0A126G1R8_WILSC|nr:hypothetical chloroplast RF17 [Wildemania schizophylla]AKS28500.1 hypothetical chloroplast RF17 [Wildemania schizophylla]